MNLLEQHNTDALDALDDEMKHDEAGRALNAEGIGKKWL